MAKYLRLSMIASGCVLLALLEAGIVHAADADKDVRERMGDVKAGTGTYAPARQATDDWDRARNLAKNDPAWRDWVTQRRYGLNAWMKLSHDNADLPVGWVHDYVDPSTGAWLTWTPSTPMPAATGSNQKQIAAWVALERLYNQGQMLEAARQFKLQGDVRYRDWAAAQMDFYARNYMKFPLQTWNGQSRMFSQALDESNQMFLLVEVIRLLRGSVDNARIADWQTNLIAPMVANQMQSRRKVHNISVWEAGAITAAGMEFNNQEWISSGRDGPLGLRGLLDGGMSSDDFWFEGSLSYQEYVVQALVSVLTAASVRNQLDSLKDVLWRAQNLMIAPAQLTFQPGVSPAINDTPPNRPSPNRPLWAQSYRVLPTWVALSDVATARSWDTLLDPPAASTKPQAVPAVVSRHFPGLDAVQVVNRDWHALMVYGQKAPSHAHQEALNLQLQHGDTWILQSPGTVGYGSPLHARYFRLAPAHNVPLIDGDGQMPYPSEGRFIALSADGNAATAAHPTYRKDAAVQRQMAVSGNDFVDTVDITRSSSAPARLGLIYNTLCQVTPDGAKAGSGDLPEGSAFSYWKNTTVYAAPANWSATLVCGNKSFRFSVSGPALQRVFVGSVPSSVKPYFRQGIYLEGNAAGAHFVTRFTPLN
ncbi:heparinase II/III domain-containing protein [Silvimonas soli]|uniref:heparinase II/III domain-containing protein n=1 Tax=Silvimonas soli TaxID=2980100 RepID=UPI0024B35FA9|nr:heparinase II/III family protein [Silvimonas soli]